MENLCALRCNMRKWTRLFNYKFNCPWFTNCTTKYILITFKICLMQRQVCVHSHATLALRPDPLLNLLIVPVNIYSPEI